MLARGAERHEHRVERTVQELFPFQAPHLAPSASVGVPDAGEVATGQGLGCFRTRLDPGGDLSMKPKASPFLATEFSDRALPVLVVGLGDDLDLEAGLHRRGETAERGQTRRLPVPLVRGHGGLRSAGATSQFVLGQTCTLASKSELRPGIHLGEYI